MSKQYRFGLGVLLEVLLAAGGVMAGSLTPPGPPGATMYTLEDIYLAVTGDSNVVNTTSGNAQTGELLSGKKAWVKGQEVTGTMPNVGQTNMTPGTAALTIPQGYHDGTGALVGDADLMAENIKKDVAIFGVTGTMLNAGVPKTGQTASYRTGDDGAYQKGVAFPNPRFTVTTNGTDEVVTDNMTGLMWVKAPHALSGNSGTMTWNNAIDFCNGLTFAGHSDWRLPNVRELQSLIDYWCWNLAFPSGHPFTGVKSFWYWSSSTHKDRTDRAWYVHLVDGHLLYESKTYSSNVLPVRTGQ